MTLALFLIIASSFTAGITVGWHLATRAALRDMQGVLDLDREYHENHNTN